MFAQEELETALQTGYEARGFELKGPGVSDEKHFLAKVERRVYRARALAGEGGDQVSDCVSDARAD
jgi:hypothetical protein